MLVFLILNGKSDLSGHFGLSIAHLYFSLTYSIILYKCVLFDISVFRWAFLLSMHLAIPQFLDRTVLPFVDGIRTI